MICKKVAASKLNMSQKTLERRMKNLEIPYFKDKKMVWFDEQDINNYLQNIKVYDKQVDKR